MMAVYEAPGWKPDGKVAVKLSTGEIFSYFERLDEFVYTGTDQL